uniref:Fucosyltransferase n=1 Tax=Meloidogyne incognita TaxID=6306 RepID=A0A914MNK6_MELIC
MMYTVECPVETLKYYDKKFLTNTFFNSSATYRLDSDVYMPHDALTKITPKTPKEYIWDQKDVLAKVKNKTKFVFQAISHCNSESGRDLITKRMSELIKLDLVGDCYGVYCDLECYNRELENHLFYLAFENNICQNYVTEKFWNSIRSLTVPIVLSRSVFKGMDVPSNAFIALDDFKSVNELVEYLRVLQNNTEKYLK